MTIQIDFEGVISTTELSELLQAQYPQQAESSLNELTQDYSNMISSGGQNCSIMSSINALVSNIASDIRQQIKDSTSGLESVIGDMIKKIGDITKSLREVIQKSVDEMMKLIDWLKDQTDEVLMQAQQVAQDLIDAVNESLGIAQGAIQEVIDFCRDIALSLSNALSDLYLRTCSTISEAINNVGYGAGIDEKVDVVKASPDEAVERSTAQTVSVIVVSYQTLTQVSEGLPNGQQARFNVDTKFNSIEDLINSGI